MMPELPELRDAVRVSAQRRYGRGARRARRSLSLVAVALAAVATLVLLPRGGAAPSGEIAATVTPAVTATATVTPEASPVGRNSANSAPHTVDLLAGVLAVFRRPPRASDRVPRDMMVNGRSGRSQIKFDPGNARRLATDGARTMYAVPALDNGQPGVCTLVLTDGGAPASMGCGPLEPARLNTRPLWSKTTYRPAPVYSLLVPDGVTMVKVHLKSGEVFDEPVQDNGVLFAVKGLVRMTWRDAEGREHSTRGA